MSVTTKTLTPTNQTVTLPGMDERPNASVLTDGIGKEADAINALSDQIAKFVTVTRSNVYQASGSDHWVISGFAPITGFVRHIVAINFSTGNLVPVRYEFGGQYGSSSLDIHIYNLDSSGVTYDMTVVVAYIPEE